MVNTLPCQVGAMSSHLINTPSGPLGVTSSIPSQVPALPSSHVTPVSSLSTPVSVTDLIASGSPYVTSPLCHIVPDVAPTPLKTTQTTSYEQPVDLPIRSDHL